MEPKQLELTNNKASVVQQTYPYLVIGDFSDDTRAIGSS